MTRRELETMLQDLFEGRLEGESFERLQDELRANPAAREAYREALLLEHALRFRCTGVDLLRVVPMDRVVARRQRRAMRHSLMAAAAILTLGLLVMAFTLGRPRVPTLSFTASTGSELVLSHDLTAEKIPERQALEPGSRLTVTRGSVELAFASGVRGIVRAPADITLQREDLLDMERGTAWFEVPRKAVGFQVRTPDLVLTDLGTEFGLITERDFSDEVHVFTGKVQLLHRRGLRYEEIVHAGQARAADPTGRWQEIPPRHGAFSTRLPDDGPAEIRLDDSVAFTTSPDNRIVRLDSYTFGSGRELSGFDPSNSDKLVVTLSHENGTIREVTYGGVRMIQSVRTSDGIRHTAIFHLDHPGEAADLVVALNGSANGIGGSLLALSDTAPGGPASTRSSKSAGVRLITKADHSFVVASHVCNENETATRGTTALPPLTPLFEAPVGSSLGGSGYRHVKSAGVVNVGFAGPDLNPATAVAVFAPAP